MTELEEAQRMLAKAIADEKAAREALHRSRQDRERAEKMLNQTRPVAAELRRHRESNGFTDTFIRLFGG